jgi:hypothetical protein
MLDLARSLYINRSVRGIQGAALDLRGIGKRTHRCCEGARMAGTRNWGAKEVTRGFVLGVVILLSGLEN